MSEYDQICDAVERSWGVDQQPNCAYTTLTAYWSIRKWLDPHVKIPRKLKKWLFGTRSARRRLKKRVWEPKISTFDAQMTLEELKTTEELPK